MAKNLEALAKNILENVGGPENVSFCTHCMTRLRLVIKDKEKVDVDKIKALEVSGCVWAGDQLQIIVGTDVNKLYPVVCKAGNFESKEAVKENLDAAEAPKKLTPAQIPGAMLRAMGECITPIIPAFITYGMFASLCAVLGPEGLGFLTADSGLYILFDTTRNAFMYFIPMLVAFSASKRFNCTTVFAMLAVAAMLYPDFLTHITEGTFNLFGIAPMAVTLNSQIIPVVLMCWLESHVEKLWDKVLPAQLNLPLKGLLTLAIILPIMTFVFTPLGTMIGNVVSGAINTLYTVSGPLVTCLMGFLWLLLIIPGMHMPVSAAFMMGFFTTGVDYVVMPIMFPLCFVAAAANAAILLRTKNKNERELASTGIISTLVGGVVEPSLYGLYLVYPRTLFSCCAGMGVSGLIMGLLHVGCYAFTATNFLSITSFVAGGISNLMKACVAIVAGMVVAFVMIMVLGLGKKKDS